MREIFPSPPKLGELTAFSRVRHGFGVREAVPLAVGSLSYRRVIMPPAAFGGSAGLWGAVLAMPK